MVKSIGKKSKKMVIEEENLDDVINDDEEEEDILEEDVDQEDDDEEEIEEIEEEILNDEEEDEEIDVEEIEEEEIEYEELDLTDDVEKDEIDDDDDNGMIDLRSEEVDYETTSLRVPDNERITENILTKYELPVVLGVRVQQLLKNAPALVSDTNGKSPMHVALDELLAGKIPFKIKRQMPYGKYEIWRLKELKVNISQDDIEELIKCINM